MFISLLCAAPAIFLSAATSLWDGVFVAVPFFLVLTTAFNCWFYLSSMRHFRPELKRAFVYLCVGTVGIGVIFVQYVSIALFNQDQRPLFRYGGLPIIATFAVAVMYVGLRRYARLLGLGSRFDSGGRLIVALCAGLIAAAAVAYVREVPDKWYFGLSIASLVLLTVLSAWAAGLAYAIMRSVTAAYAVSMRRIFLFAVGVCVAAPIFATLITVRGELYGDALNVALAICAIPPMLLLLHSGASFKKETAK